MNAWVLEDIGDIRYKKCENPEPGTGEVLVEVHAAGICGSDIPRIFRDGAHRMPLICGHEFSGKVIEAKGAYANDWMGKRVGIFPLIPCRCTDIWISDLPKSVRKKWAASDTI